MSARITAILFAVVATTLMGSLITAALSMGLTSGRAIELAAAIGFVVSVPVSWLVARSIAGKMA